MSSVVVCTSHAETVAHGAEYIVWIKNDGSLWGEGLNDKGQLGQGSISYLHTPAEIIEGGVVKVMANKNNTLLLKSNGSIWGMGYNFNGQLCDGTRTMRNKPVKIIDRGVIDFYLGESATLILTDDGSLICGGINKEILGAENNSWGNPMLVKKIYDYEEVKDFGVNYELALILYKNGILESLNDGRLLRKGSIVQKNQVISQNVKNFYLSKCDGGSLFVNFNDRSTKAMGHGLALGDGSIENKYTLSLITGLRDVSVIKSVGELSGTYPSDHSLVIKEDGSLWGMGRETGIGFVVSGIHFQSPFPIASSPEKLVDGKIVDCDVDRDNSIFLFDDGSLFTMGSRNYFIYPFGESYEVSDPSLDYLMSKSKLRRIATDVKIPPIEKKEKDLRDNDSDGLNNYEEISQYFTNPDKSDSDEDGIMDGKEINLGLDPNISDKALIDFISSNFQLTDDINQTKIYESGKADGIKEVQNQPSNFGLVPKSTYQQVPSPSSSKSINEIESTPYTQGWFYSPDAGWLWTNSKAFPHFFEASSSKWIYFKEGSDPSLFFDYDLNTWSSLKELPYKRWLSSFNDWKKEPEKYGGEYVLEKVKEAYENNSTELLLSSEKILDLTPVASLRKLTRLFLSNVETSDVSSLSKLNNLEYLNLEINQISDIRALSNLTNLKYLNLQQNKIEDIFALSKLNNLKELYLGFNFDLVSVLPLKNLDNLEVLGLENAIRKSSDVATLAELKKLKDLKLTYNKLEDISWIADLTEMEKLYLSYNSLKDLSALKKLNRIDTLFLEQNSDLNIKAIPDLYNLKRLYFGKNNLSNLDSINRFTQLEDLGLSSNNLSDVKELHDLKNLVNLSLSSNPLSESQVSELEANLPRVIKVNF